MATISIIETSDGSHSLLNSELNETYHSVHGALQESLHVFIKNGLTFVAEKNNSAPIRILEIGFGTGLNALLALQYSQSTNRKIHYSSLEVFPLEKEIWSKLNYAQRLDMSHEFSKLHNSSWNEDQLMSENFVLRKIKQSIEDTLLDDNAYDLVFFDAFAPGKQPEMWKPGIFSKLFRAMKENAVLVTYCAKGQVKRDLRETGFIVEALTGPPGKKEMIRAAKIRE